MSHDPGDEHHRQRSAYPVGMIHVGDAVTFDGFEVVITHPTGPGMGTLVITTVDAQEIEAMVPIWQRWIPLETPGDYNPAPEGIRATRIDANSGGSNGRPGHRGTPWGG